MPLFDYHCEKCAIKEERLVPVSEAYDQKCSVCGEQMEKEFPNTFDFTLKGRWFKTTKGY